MNVFQRAYDFIKSLSTPAWLKILLQEIQDLIVATAIGIGKEYLRQLEEKICEVAQDPSLTNEQKFKAVFKWGQYNIPNIKDASLNLCIEILVNLLKKKGFSRII